ncbi:MAG: hypothetical protein MOGMAGMI_00558 [Candidatus Omnitrophica bacterium]|nr:hypothetical protein [Candidatus Omnitrophota bacterium]
MNVRPRRKGFLSLESVAMTDIVMNLFIFFFVSFSLLYTFNPHKESKIEVKLPQGGASQASEERQPLTVTITAGNEIFVGPRRIQPSALKKEMTEAAKTHRDTGILVRSDRRASVDHLVKVLDAAKQAGMDKLGVAIERQGAV